MVTLWWVVNTQGYVIRAALQAFPVSCGALELIHDTALVDDFKSLTIPLVYSSSSIHFVVFTKLFSVCDILLPFWVRRSCGLCHKWIAGSWELSSGLLAICCPYHRCRENGWQLPAGEGHHYTSSVLEPQNPERIGLAHLGEDWLHPFPLFYGSGAAIGWLLLGTS